MTRALHTNECLTVIDLGGNSIGPEGAIAVADALRDNTSLRTLYLGGNYIGNAGSIAMGLVLKHSTGLALRSLFLDGNGLCPADIGHIAQGVGRNVSLRCLVLRENQVGREGSIALLRAVKMNSQLGLNQLEGIRLDRDTLVRSQRLRGDIERGYCGANEHAS